MEAGRRAGKRPARWTFGFLEAIQATAERLATARSGLSPIHLGVYAGWGAIENLTVDTYCYLKVHID
jgi:hypothetical protein